MNVREMQIEFERRLILINPDFDLQDRPTSDTTVSFLNRAQDLYIEENFISKDRLEDNIEYIQRRSDTLRSLISRNTGTETAAKSADFSDGGIQISVPSDYLYYIKSYSYVDGDAAGNNVYLTNGSKEWIPNRVGTHEEIEKIVSNSFNTPILRKPCVLFEESNKLILYKDSNTNVYNFELVYLRDPKKMTVTATGVGTPTNETNVCELPVGAHEDVVDLAVKVFIEEYKYKLSQERPRR
jgi:hypothetical protein